MNWGTDWQTEIWPHRTPVEAKNNIIVLKAYFILDEYILAGEIQDTSKKSILNAIRLQDFIQEEETPQGLFEDAGLG